MRKMIALLLVAAGSCAAQVPTLVQDVSWGTNDGGKTARYWSFSLPNPALANNLVVCGLTYTGATAAATITDDQNNTWMQGPASDDGTHVVTLMYAAGVAAGTQNLALTLSAARYDVHLQCAEFYNVATFSPADGSSSTSDVTGPNIAAGSFATTADGDLIFHYGIDDSGFCCNHPVTSYVPGTGFNLLASRRVTPTFAQYAVQNTHGTINPTMTVNQTSHEAFGSAAMAFKAAATGTAPSGVRIVHAMVFSPPNPGGNGTITEQFPCYASGDTIVATGSTSPAQFDLTRGGAGGFTDSEGNPYTAVSFADYPQLFYAQNITCGNPNSRTVTDAFRDGGSPDPVMLYDITGVAPASFDSTMGIVKAFGQQAQKSTTDTSCPNDGSVNSTLRATPSSPSGIIIVVENNGQGPECGMSGPGNVFDSAWFQGEDDECCGMLNSSSGYGHIFYSSAAQQTATFNWANSAASGSSGWAIVMANFMSASAPIKNGPPPTILPPSPSIDGSGPPENHPLRRHRKH